MNTLIKGTYYICVKKIRLVHVGDTGLENQWPSVCFLVYLKGPKKSCRDGLSFIPHSLPPLLLLLCLPPSPHNIRNIWLPYPPQADRLQPAIKHAGWYTKHTQVLHLISITCSLTMQLLHISITWENDFICDCMSLQVKQDNFFAKY